MLKQTLNGEHKDIENIIINDYDKNVLQFAHMYVQLYIYECMYVYM